MKEATSTRDVPSGREEQRERKRRVAQSSNLAEASKAKTFDQLSPKEKDDLLKAIALRLGMISPD